MAAAAARKVHNQPGAKTVQEYIDELPVWSDGTALKSTPMTGMQWRIWTLAAFGKFFEGFVVFMGGVTLPLITREFHLAASEKGLVTSASLPLARARMGAAGLRMPAVAITAEDVPASKPDPSGFLMAAAALGVDPAECVVFEDSYAGITAGRAAGMRVVGVGAAAVAHDPTRSIPDLRAVTITREEGLIRLAFPG